MGRKENWGFVMSIALLGALAIFLFGMSTMTSLAWKNLTSGKLASLLEKLTDNIFKGVLLGAVVAGMVHSSAATTVMCIGFVNAGILKLRQAVGVIMGANIGTTITAQILRLGGLSDENLFLALLKPEMLGPLTAFVGILFFSFFNSGRKKTVGQILIGLGLLFIGIKSMESALAPLTELEAFQQLFIRFSNPVLGIAVGAAITALIRAPPPLWLFYRPFPLPAWSHFPPPCHHHGPEHRHLRHCHLVQHRRQPER